MSFEEAKEYITDYTNIHTKKKICNKYVAKSRKKSLLLDVG